jgi:hypothetical protein
MLGILASGRTYGIWKKRKKTMVWYPSAFFATGEISPRRQFLNQKVENCQNFRFCSHHVVKK